ncbi:uncharacterized protein SPPG_01614 [Spizellomyces punctatus DAOM BR117]|uniref:Phytase-like domain-containing protein n=1 Tax=Spizellomyces punctatus (strain DAOM BR117) TaxID=645134 RepID=A0A0L0HS48_SPIPD|nr:uncharacterized protein SPPG_01614 [Spizellomyces punctatus DAOM BR117]KND04181.1 hypothetical protein SPPG_01614 [Spizellomyces punctatus DAOM BR117]|eukprot:XP_016612220.1 hypothetical protein SPPG_01614 [Spizellomyces punctatus DAOM BR117]
MPNIFRTTASLLAASVILSSTSGTAAFPVPEWITSLKEFGTATESLLKIRSLELFGILAPLPNNAPPTQGPYRKPTQKASDQVLLSPGLTARYLTRQIANHADQPSFWPCTGEPTHAVFCIEAEREEIEKPGAGNFSKIIPKFNPSVQAVDLKTGKVTTFLRGMTRCDGLRVTPWGTVLATEEDDKGGVYEIFDPFNLPAGTTVTDRATGSIADATGAKVDKVVKRTALPTIAWEGLYIDPSGVVYGGDELRPGSGKQGANGGSLYKFVPTKPLKSKGVIRNPADSPLAAGAVYAFQASCIAHGEAKFPQAGQGCEIGEGGWVRIPNPSAARSEADRVRATGYYRPEDLINDPHYKGPGVRICWTNTGAADAKNYGEVNCLIDETVVTDGEISRHQQSYATIGGKVAYATANRFITGTPEFNQPDNLDFQPNSRNVAIIEDNPNGDIFMCLPDGADKDTESDGCIRFLSVRDTSAEPTGFTFLPGGTKAILSIQHSNDELMTKVDGFDTDDILIIEGFRKPLWA